MGVYRENGGGIWAPKQNVKKEMVLIHMYRSYKKHFPADYRRKINDLISGKYKRILNYYKDNNMFTKYLFLNIYFKYIYINLRRVEYFFLKGR